MAEKKQNEGRTSGLPFPIECNFTLRRIVERGDRPLIGNARAAYEIARATIEDAAQEAFMAFFLDVKNRLIKAKIMHVGTVDSSAVYPREVIREALTCDASAMVFSHNHPSGDPDPSLCDRAITRELVFASKVMGLKVLDHIVIGDNAYFSFADHGLIGDYDLQALSLQSR